MKSVCLFVLSFLVAFGLISCNSPATQSPSSEVGPASTPSEKRPVPSPASRWDVSRENNELDKTAKVTISTSDFVFRCSPKFEGYIRPTINSFGHSLESEDGGGQTVRYRIDDRPVRKQHWSMSTNYEALFLPTATLQAALKGKKLVVEYKPSYVVPQTETFNLDGLQEAARAAGCKL